VLFGRSYEPGSSVEERRRKAVELPLRSLAHLGDAVHELYQRERLALEHQTMKGLHNSVVALVNSRQQARLLQNIKDQDLLTEQEADLVRRARNLKTAGFRKNVEQSTLRQATAFEALVGFLYLTDEMRLMDVLQKAEIAKISEDLEEEI